MQQKGWQAPLIQAIPNLKNFEWMTKTFMITAPVLIPVITTTVVRSPQGPVIANPNGSNTPTGYARFKPTTAPINYVRTPYLKPSKLAMTPPPIDSFNPNVHGATRDDSLLGRVLPRRYDRPIRLAPPVSLPDSEGNNNLSGRLVPANGTTALNGKLAPRNGTTALAGKMIPSAAATYGGYPAASGRGSGGDGQQTRTEVSARLTSSHRGSLLQNGN